MKLKYILPIVCIIIFILAAPILARIGSWTVVKRWEAPKEYLGYERQIYLEISTFKSYFDIIGYSQQKLSVTDGGYAYIFNFEVPFYPAEQWIKKCKVEWSTEKVMFISEDGLEIHITSKSIKEQIGEQ